MTIKKETNNPKYILTNPITTQKMFFVEEIDKIKVDSQGCFIRYNIEISIVCQQKSCAQKKRPTV